MARAKLPAMQSRRRCIGRLGPAALCLMFAACGGTSGSTSGTTASSNTSAEPTTAGPTTDTGETTEATATSDETTEQGTTATACPEVGPEEVTLTTADGVELIADLYTTGMTGSPVVLLLHMIPPGNDKSNFSPEFIDGLRAKGFAVLNINRRGAPGSGGSATEAYQGPNGVEDAIAGYAFVQNHECAMSVDNLAIVGASNGSTTALDFTVKAAADGQLSQPRAMVFLSGGMYTENQNKIADNQALLANHPVLLAYPPAEAAWNTTVLGLGISGWQGMEVSPGGHGTHMFGSNPEVMTEVANFLATSLEN